ncbi:MAG TPA: hypothetical protein VF681_03795 [Abditibacteriaceae bacterium]|jgi:hypothetical protein
MESIHRRDEQHTIEPELRQTPPRPVSRRKGAGCQNGCVLVFLLPHTLVGIGLLLWSLLQLAVLLFGVTVPGTIQDVSSSRGSKGGYTYHASYEYRVNGVTHQVKSQISAKEYGLASRGQSVGVKALPMLPNWGSVLLVPGAGSAGNGLQMLPMALFWNAFLAVFYYFILGQSWKERSLVRGGIAVVGTVVEKKISRGKNTSHIVIYDYIPSTPGSGDVVSTQRGQMTVPKEAYDSLQVGQSATVLHDAVKVRRSVLYAPASYGAE